MESIVHVPVLLQETIHALTHGKSSEELRGVWVDGTFGRGGHSRFLLKHLPVDARLIVLDRDPQAIDAAHVLAGEDSRVTVVHANFSQLDAVLSEQQVSRVSGILVDIGVSSPQLDDGARGFSFMREGHLDMRMNFHEGLTVSEWLEHATVSDIHEVIKYYGEERYAFQIAKAIATRCAANGRIQTTTELAELVARVVRSREKGQHPATRTFQALRIFINQELKELTRFLVEAIGWLAPQARLATICFHSLEDRIVKQFFQKLSTNSPLDRRIVIKDKDLPPPFMEKVGKWKASDEEKNVNARARSAILRVAERTNRVHDIAVIEEMMQSVDSVQQIEVLQNKLKRV